MLLAVRGVVADFKAMTERVDDMITVARAGTARYPRDEVHEVADFLEWLLRGNFVLLGAREYDFSDGTIRVVDGSGLGILRDEDRSAYCEPVPLSDLPPAVRERATSGDLLLVTKTNAISPVHRHERMDYVGVRLVSRSGEIVGESRLLGLFTSKAFAERASETPLLHRKLRQALDAEDLIEGSHDYKAAVALFDSFPKEELFAAPVDDLRRAVVALTGLEGSDRVRLLGRRDADGRSASLILALPRSRYSPTLVARVSALLRAPLRRPPASRRTTCSTRASACGCTSSCTPRAGCPRSRCASSRPRSSRSPARGTTSSPTSSTNSTAPAQGARWQRRGRRCSPSTTRATPSRSWRRSTSRASRGSTRASRSWSACTRSAPTGRRAWRCTSAAARSSSRA